MVNVGSIDRVVRLVVGLLLIALPFLPPAAGLMAGWGAWQYALVAVGAVLVATAALRICPAYVLLGIRTCAAGKA